MIGRLWHGRTTEGNADPYQSLLKAEVLPGIRIEGYRGAYVLRRDAGDGVEFATLTLWDSLDAVREFAGDDYERAVVLPEARRLLTAFDERSGHYEIVLEP